MELRSHCCPESASGKSDIRGTESGNIVSGPVYPGIGKTLEVILNDQLSVSCRGPNAPELKLMRKQVEWS